MEFFVAKSEKVVYGYEVPIAALYDGELSLSDLSIAKNGSFISLLRNAHLTQKEYVISLSIAKDTKKGVLSFLD